ncbi:MAG TPA: NAD(P)-binding domain-containing protein [Terriglobales bacterium]|nr:NAD(P)-binding domain-containing protein [Terriglobales bacterium]
MNIGIIGAGNIGSMLTRRLSALGHKVFVANSRGPETLKDLAQQTGATPVTVKEAAHKGEVVIVTIPMKSVPNLPRDLFDGVSDKVVVVDTNNYYPQQRDGRIEAIENGLPESRWVEQQLGHPVVKAFNNMRAPNQETMGRPKGAPDRKALPVSSDDPRAKQIVMQLIEELGFDAIDNGGLDQSWRQQPGTPVYTTDKNADGVRRALAEANQQRSPQFKAA